MGWLWFLKNNWRIINRQGRQERQGEQKGQFIKLTNRQERQERQGEQKEQFIKLTNRQVRQERQEIDAWFSHPLSSSSFASFAVQWFNG